MKRIVKVATLCLASIVMFTGIFTGCGKKSSDTEKSNTQAVTKETATPQLAEVKLSFYTLGGTAYKQGTVAAQEELNKMLKKDLNTTIQFNLVSYADEKTKYALINASGEAVDAMTLSGAFSAEANKGAFRALDELIPKYAPICWSSIAKEDWNTAKLNEKIMGVNFPTSVNRSGFAWREDLRKKYNAPEVKDIDSLIKFMDIIVKNEKEMSAYAAPGTNARNLVDAMFAKKGYTLGLFVSNLNLATNYVSGDDKVDMRWVYEMPEAKEFFTTVKSLADSGYWPKNSFADKTAPLDLFKNEKAASLVANLMNINAMVAELKSKNSNIEIGWFPIREKDFYPTPKPTMALPVTGKNPERTLMALDKLGFDQKYQDVARYGVPDKDFTLNAEGKVKVLPAANDFEEGSIAGWTNGNLRRSLENGIPAFDEAQKSVDKWGIKTKLSTFILNTEQIKTETASIASVNTEYLNPLLLGLVDVESGLKTYKEKMTAAGADKVKAEIQKQWDAYRK